MVEKSAELKKSFLWLSFDAKLRNSDLRFWKTGFHNNGVYFRFENNNMTHLFQKFPASSQIAQNGQVCIITIHQNLGYHLNLTYN